MGRQRRLDLALVDEHTEALGATLATVALSSLDRQLLRDVAGGWPRIDLSATTASEVPA